MRKTRKYKKRKYKKRKTKRRKRRRKGGSDDDDEPKLIRSSSAPGVMSTEEFPSKDEIEEMQFETPRAKDPEKAILIQEPPKYKTIPRGFGGQLGVVAKGVGQFASILMGRPNRRGGRRKRRTRKRRKRKKRKTRKRRRRKR